jgi:long-chain fatty acid transport protein
LSKPHRSSLRLLVLSSVIAMVSSAALGSGFALFEQGAKATSMGGAFTARADDPSAMFYNVAGIAFQREMAASAGATAILFANSFRGTSGYPGPDHVSQYEDHTFVLPNAYFVVPVGENATFGIGQFTAFGLRTDWENGATFPGRFISQDANIKTMSLQPSFAMKTANDRFAWGVGLEYRASHITLERNNAAINPFTQRIADVAHVRLDSDWNDGWGWNAGVLFRASENWRFGAQYRAPIDIDYEGTATFRQIPTGFAQFDAMVAAQLPPNQDITTMIAFPSFISLGLATSVIPNWEVQFDVVRTGWSRLDGLTVEFSRTPAANLEIPMEWEDSTSYRIGASRPVTDRWSVRLGALYDETPQPLSEAGPLLPDAPRYSATFGVGWDNGQWSVDLSNMILVFEQRDTTGVSRDQFYGRYTTNALLVSMNAGYRF